jgi:hypothetical protein
MAVCRSRAPDLAWTVDELRPLSLVVARLSWFSTSAVVDATSMHVDARRPRPHHPSQHSDSSLCRASSSAHQRNPRAASAERFEDAGTRVDELPYDPQIASLIVD